MKNNKGFAITATIYGFLVLFLIILLSVLSVMRSNNNRSITISEKIDDRVFPTNEVVVDDQANYSISTSSPSNSNLSNLKRGKYYARIFVNGSPNDNCFFYVPNGGTISLDGNVLKVKSGTNATIYKSDGSVLTNSNITNVVVTKYYVSK